MRPRKRLGQNFLIDRNVLNRIVDAAAIEAGSSVLEIGGGFGVVTRELAAWAERVVCVEADRALEAILRETLAGLENVEVVIADFLKLDLARMIEERGGGKWVVVGNLPYYITSPILVKLVEARRQLARMVLMVQREVADRLQARPGTDDYGALSVYVQYHCEMNSVLSVSRNVFYPVPEVDSELIRLVPRPSPPVAVQDEGLFFDIVRSAFGKRRKTLLNALSSSAGLAWNRDRAERALTAAGINAGRRGETLSMEEFARIANAAT